MAQRSQHVAGKPSSPERLRRLPRVIALEPSEREYDRLLANLELNRLSNVVPLRLGAHARPGRSTLRIGEFGHEGQNTLGEFAYGIAELRREEIDLETLDRIVSSRCLSRVDVLKIDAEGAEPAILERAGQVLGDFKPLEVRRLLRARHLT